MASVTLMYENNRAWRPPSVPLWSSVFDAVLESKSSNEA